METRYYKYYILNTETKNLNTTILGSASSLHHAIELMQKYMDDNFKFDDYLKAYYVNLSTVCIYRYHYLMPKELLTKITIIKYPTTIIEENSDI